MWAVFAVLSAVFAALTSILAKVGIEGVDSNLATAIRTIVVVIMAWGMVFITHTQGELWRLKRRVGYFLFCQDLQQVHPGCVIIRRYRWEVYPRWCQLTS